MLVRGGAAWHGRDDWGWGVLHEAAVSGCQQVISWTFSRSVSGKNDRDKLGRTPLLAALMAGVGVEAVQELLLQGADPLLGDSVGRTCAEAAVLYCSPATARVVLDYCVNQEMEIDRELLLELAEDNQDMVDTIKSCCNLIYIKQAFLEPCLKSLSTVHTLLKDIHSNK